MAAVHGNGPRDEPQWEMVQHEKAASTQNVSEVVLMDEISTWRYILIMFRYVHAKISISTILTDQLLGRSFSCTHGHKVSSKRID